jgi:hypothetical protein
MKVKGRGRRFSVTSGVGVGVAGSVIGRSGGLVLVSRCSGLLSPVFRAALVVTGLPVSSCRVKFSVGAGD